MSNYKTKNSIPIIFDRKKILYKNFDKIKLYKNIAHEISQRLNETTFSYNYGIEINSKSNEAHSIINAYIEQVLLIYERVYKKRDFYRLPGTDIYIVGHTQIVLNSAS